MDRFQVKLVKGEGAYGAFDTQRVRNGHDKLMEIAELCEGMNALAELVEVIEREGVEHYPLLERQYIQAQIVLGNPHH